jgi:5-methylcytosine-specific restriction enzyme B
MFEQLSKACEEVMHLLQTSKNVLLSGPPGVGKTRLLAEIAAQFEAGNFSDAGVPTINHGNAIAIQDAEAPRVFRTVFHQNSKYRDFVTGMAPAIGEGRAGEFAIVKGTLYRAAEYAQEDGCASLLIIDEINRGPAVQVFGGSLVAIEADKRLNPSGEPHALTQYFEVMVPPNGEIVQYALPDRLYILAVQNQADSSVEPMDVAFLRRFEPYRLNPDEVVLRAHFDLGDGDARSLPAAPATFKDVFEASVRAWGAVNERIAVGRGKDFQIGHGVLMGTLPDVVSVEDAEAIVARGWDKIVAHVTEVFYGDVRSVAITLNALEADGSGNLPFWLTEHAFGGELRYELVGGDTWTREALYAGLLAIAR